jgi:hypothetical protein
MWKTRKHCCCVVGGVGIVVDHHHWNGRIYVGRMIDETNGSSFWGGILLVLDVQLENDVENLWIAAKDKRAVSRFLW